MPDLCEIKVNRAVCDHTSSVRVSCIIIPAAFFRAEIRRKSLNKPVILH